MILRNSASSSAPFCICWAIFSANFRGLAPGAAITTKAAAAVPLTKGYVCTVWQGIRGSVVRTQSRKVEVRPYYLDILLKITGSSLLKLRYERCFRLSSRTTTLRRRGLDSSKAHVVAGPWAEAAAIAAIAVNGRGWGRPDQAGQQSRRLYFSRCVEVVVWSFFFCFALLCKGERDLALLLLVHKHCSLILKAARSAVRRLRNPGWESLLCCGGRHSRQRPRIAVVFAASTTWNDLEGAKQHLNAS